jgi:hypothetical protein
MNALQFCPFGTPFHVIMEGLFHAHVTVDGRDLDITTCTLRSKWDPLKNYRRYSLLGQPLGHTVTMDGELTVR